MNKWVKITLIAIGFLILLAGAAFAGYYFATDGEVPFFEKETVPSENGDQDPVYKPKKQVYEQMKEPSYNEYALVYLNTGNLIGNLLTGGRVVPTLSSVYQAIPKVGIYKFSQSSEDISFLSIPSELSAEQDYFSLNRIEGRMLYIDSVNHALYAVDTDGNNRIKLADGAEMCYVYEHTAYFTTAQGVYSVSVSGGEITTLFEKADCTVTLVGLSNSRIYFCVRQGEDCQWLAVGLKQPAKDVLRFLEDTKGDTITGAQYSDGWLYYLKKGDLYRKHIDVEDESRIAEGVTQYVVDKNCVYFGKEGDGSYNVWELNTASGAVKIVLSVPVTGGAGDLVCYVGGEYIYAVGTDGSGKSINCRTCLWTAANDLMYYNRTASSWTFANE